MSDATHDEYGQRDNGVVCSLDKFDSVFGLKFGHLLFDAAKQLCRTLQAKDTTLQEATVAVTFTKAYYARLRTDSEFNRFFGVCVAFAEGKTANPVLPHHR